MSSSVPSHYGPYIIILYNNISCGALIHTHIVFFPRTLPLMVFRSAPIGNAIIITSYCRSICILRRRELVSETATRSAKKWNDVKNVISLGGCRISCCLRYTIYNARKYRLKLYTPKIINILQVLHYPHTFVTVRIVTSSWQTKILIK